MNAAVKPYQFETTEDFQCLVDPNDPDYRSRYKEWHGGRGSGKSTQLARAAIFRGSIKPLRILCTREYQNSISESILVLLAAQIKKMGLEDKYDIQRNGIFGKNGTEFIFKGLKHGINSIKSMEGIDICLVEEAQTISEESWSILIPTIRAEESEIWLCWNVYEESDPTYQRFVINTPPNCFSRVVNYDRNPWFPDVLRAEMEYDKARDYSLYLHVWEGHPLKRNEALVFKHWSIDESIAPAEDEVFYYGSDFGFANDPTTLIRMWVDDKNRKIFIDYEAYGIGVEIDDTPDLYDLVPGSRKWNITADCARPETISYLKRQGFKIKGAKKGAGSVDEGVKFLQSYDIVAHPRCKHVIDELSSYSFKIDRLTDEVLAVLKDEKNHMIDAMRYGLEAVRRRMRINIG